ncbi:hypothetical protein R1flu_010195 [Riccia fluitans]|uniref:Uncharacterized protein n=1 Tax=Riccia fluitans TaxID=41844 RepID=A0ABD1Z4E4_9MARC
MTFEINTSGTLPGSHPSVDRFHFMTKQNQAHQKRLVAGDLQRSSIINFFSVIRCRSFSAILISVTMDNLLVAAVIAFSSPSVIPALF